MSPVVPSLSPVLSQDEEKDARIDAKDATSSSKVATLDEKVASLEPKDTKVIVFCRKDDFPSLFRGKLANFVCVFNYNKVQPQHNKNGE